MAEVADRWARILLAARRRRRERFDEGERLATLQEALVLGCSTVPGTLECSLTLLPARGDFTTEVSSGPLALTMDETQYDAGDGPCLSAARHQRMERIDAMAADQRWPELSERAAAQGIHSSLSLPIAAVGGARALNFYGAEDFGYASDRSTQLAGFVAHVASVFLPEGAGDEADLLRTEPGRAALAHNAEVKRAQAAVMERDGVDATTAYRTLALQSAERAQPLIQIARAVLNGQDAR